MLEKIKKVLGFSDGIYNVTNSLANTRNSLSKNIPDHTAITYAECSTLYKNGIGNKIVRLKTGYALKDTINFATEHDEQQYNDLLARKVKDAAKWMLAFGRGIIVFHHVGDDLSRARKNFDMSNCKISVFSADMVSVAGIDFDIQSEFYMKPEYYNVRGVQIHNSRVVDFTYVKPVEYELPTYRWGGISEFEIIRDQLISDGIIARASAHAIEKSSSLFYKVDGFRAALRAKQDTAIVTYFTEVEKLRSIYGAGIVDKEDEVEAITQTLQNLAETDQIALRRIAMVTGISLIDLVGETPGGLGETGAGELRTTREMIQGLQSEYLLGPINECMDKFELGHVWFKECQGQTPEEIVEYEAKVIDNAIKLESIGEDGLSYLEEKGLKQQTDILDMFGGDVDADSDTDLEGGAGGDDPMAKDPDAALNGAQVTALLDIMNRVAIGEITKNTAAKIITVAFPLSKTEADNLVSDLKEGSVAEQGETENNKDPEVPEEPGENDGESSDSDGGKPGEGLEEANDKQTDEG